ncbi:hypothetical protein ACIF6L_34960 [Kitasatospora sp. NPDC086009]|uniref:hypothetical protein n=1 Tax=unclassified Kitasatospora TaxID=2633591 RepID=UPI0037C7C1A6
MTSRARSIYLAAEVKEGAQDRARAEGEDLAVYARQAWDQFLAGDLIPQPPRRAVRGSGETKAKLVQWEEDEFWDSLTERCKDAAEEHGFKVNPSTLVEQHLRHLLGMDDPAEE